MSEPTCPRKLQPTDVGNVVQPGLLDPSSQGWPGMFKAVREVDVNKVNDCKDDIDTLLVFAGLYSAVLTAFIIESYQNLQQDKQDVMIDLMQKFLVKHYDMNPRSTNSTNPTLPPLPPFEPPLWAIRVNVLWFLSLILSLTAASLGMLVKQWLREYLALDYVSARERLRAREYRNPSLSTWGVFGVAAALPLMLQVSLGLFFVGLCYFTSAVHSSIGRTTVPVVAAWSFFVFLTTLAPLLSPRCPYKTTFLRAAMKAGRRHVAPIIRPLVSTCWQRLHAVITACVVGVSAQPLENPTSAPGAANWSQVLLEEEVVVQSDQDDVDILVSVDVFRADDSLLPAMLAVLGQPKDAVNLVKFVVHIINVRTGLTLPDRHITTVPDLRGLPKQTWHYLTDALARSGIQLSQGGLPSACPEWVLDSLVIFLAHSDFPLSGEGRQALNLFFGYRSRQHYGRDLARRLSHTDSAHSLRLATSLSRNLFQIGGGPLCSSCINALYNQRLQLDVADVPALRERRADQSFWKEPTTASVLEDCLDCFVHLLVWALPLRNTAVVGAGRVLVVAMELCCGLGRRDTLVALCKLAWPVTFWVQVFASTFGAVHDRDRIFSKLEEGVAALSQAYMVSSNEARKDILNHRPSMFQHYTQGIYDNSDCYAPLDIVRICYTHLRVQQHISAWVTAQRGQNPNVMVVGAEHEDWFEGWVACAQALHRYHETRGWARRESPRNNAVTSHPLISATSGSVKDDTSAFSDDCAMATECLEVIQSFNSNGISGARIEDGSGSSSGGQGTFPEGLLEALNLFVVSDQLEEDVDIVP